MTIKNVGIIGAGTMGSGIAQAFATKGLPSPSIVSRSNASQ